MPKAKSKSDTPKAIAVEPAGSPGVADYFNAKPQKPRSVLIAMAADIIILSRCEGAPATARYFAQKLNFPVTEKMIKSIKSKAAKGEIVVTKDELVTAAMSHPITAARVKREPYLCEIKPPTVATNRLPELKQTVENHTRIENNPKVLVTLTIATQAG
jgi:hypothetical protein